jgi:membrane-associated phospholipid phosphatase
MRLAPLAPALLVLTLSGRALGEEPEARVPVLENFSKAEVVLIGLGSVLAAVTVGAQGRIVDDLDPPLIGEPPSIDRWFADLLDRPGTDPWLWRIPDRLGGVVAPAAAMLWYLVDGAAVYVNGRALSGDPNADHETLAFLEGYTWTIGLTQMVKFAVGRERPDHALRGVPVEGDEEAYLSFWSLHAASSFYLAAFVNRDLSDYLVSGPLAGASPGKRVFLGRVLPAVALYGTAGVISASRLIDQRHYFTDVFLGTALGIAAGNLAYYLHFDANGRPRRSEGSIQLTPVPGGIGLAGRF